MFPFPEYPKAPGLPGSTPYRATPGAVAPGTSIPPTPTPYAPGIGVAAEAAERARQGIGAPPRAPGVSAAPIPGMSAPSVTAQKVGLLSRAGSVARIAAGGTLGSGLMVTSTAAGLVDGAMDRHDAALRAKSPNIAALPKRAPTAVAGAPVARPGVFERDDDGNFYPQGSYTADGGATVYVPGEGLETEEEKRQRAAQIAGDITPDGTGRMTSTAPQSLYGANMAAIRKNDAYSTQTPGQFSQTVQDALAGYEGSAQQKGNIDQRMRGQATADARAVPWAPGIVKVNSVPGMLGPLYSNNATNPLGGMNTAPGVNGQVGNLSVIGIDKAAIERGIQAEKELHAARLEAMDGRPADGPRVASIGGSSGHGWRAKQAEAELALRQQQIALQATQSQQRSQIDWQRLGMEGQRLGLDAQRFGMEQVDRNMTLQQRQQLADLQQQYLLLNEANDPGGGRRKALASQLLLMQGKIPPGLEGKFRVVEIGGGQDADMRQLPKHAFLLNQETGQSLPFGTQQLPPSPYKGGTELVGKDGKKYVVQNGQPVLKG